jgi:hypothetical protein
MEHFLVRDRRLDKDDVDAGQSNWYWRDFAVEYFNTKDPELTTKLNENLFDGDSDFASATFTTAYEATTDKLRKKFMEIMGILREIKYNFCQSGQGDDGLSVEELVNDSTKPIRSSNLRDFFPRTKDHEFTKDGTALFYMFTMLHDNNAFDTVFGEIPTDATASSEATPQTYSRGSVKPAKTPQLDVAALLNAPIKIARSKDEDDLTAAEAKKVRAELAALAEKQIDEDMEKLMGLTDKLTGIDKSTRTGTYRMIMSRRETLKTRLRAAAIAVSPARTREEDLLGEVS